MAQSQMQSFAFKTQAVSTVALALTAVGGVPFTAAEVLAADEVYVTVETNPLRYRTDGTAPDASTGHLVAGTGSFTITGKRDVSQLRLIRQGGADATVMVTLRKRIT